MRVLNAGNVTLSPCSEPWWLFRRSEVVEAEGGRLMSWAIGGSGDVARSSFKAGIVMLMLGRLCGIKGEWYSILWSSNAFSRTER